MDAINYSQASGFSYFDKYHHYGLPITPGFSRPVSACSPQAPTLYSNGPAMSSVTNMTPMTSPQLIKQEPMMFTYPAGFHIDPSALHSPLVDMFPTSQPMFSGVEDWTPPHTPDAYGIPPSATPSFTSVPALSPSPSPIEATTVDPRTLAPTGLFKTEEVDSYASVDFESILPNDATDFLTLTGDMPMLPSHMSLTNGVRSRAGTVSSTVSLGNAFFETNDFQIDESALEFLERPAKRVKASPSASSSPSSPATVAAAPSPAATEILEAASSPVPVSTTPILPPTPPTETPVPVPTIGAAPSAPPSTSSSPAPTAVSRRGRKQSLTEDPSKTFVCDLCNRRFRRQEHLKRHYRSLHTQEKPFECNDCGKKFSRSDNLAQHARTHGSGAIVMDIIDGHGYEGVLLPTGGDYSAYGKVLFQMPTDMMPVVEENKKKRRRED